MFRVCYYSTVCHVFSEVTPRPNILAKGSLDVNSSAGNSNIIFPNHLFRQSCLLYQLVYYQIKLTMIVRLNNL